MYGIHGDVKDRDGQVQAFRAPGRAALLVNASCCEGFEVPECGLVVFWSLDWSFVSWKQALGRVQRVNAVKRNVYVDIYVRGTVDEDVLKCISAKKDFYARVSSGR